MAIYNGTGTTITRIDGTLEPGVPMKYFATQADLDNYLNTNPTGDWYAAVADKTYEVYGEQVVFNLSGTSDVQSIGSTTVKLSDNHTNNYATYFDVVPNGGHDYEIQVKKPGKYRVIINATAGTTNTQYPSPTLNVRDRDNNTLGSFIYSGPVDKMCSVSGNLIIDKAGYYYFSSRFNRESGGADELNIDGTVEFRQITKEGAYND